jgi:hypothetical protein
MDVIGCSASVMDVTGSHRTGHGCDRSHRQARQRTTHDLRIGRTLIPAVLPQDRDA